MGERVGDAATKRREAAPRQLTVARSSRAIAGERRPREREREIIQLASDATGGGEVPRASPTSAPLLSLSPYLLPRPDTGTLSLGLLSLTLFLSLPVCMVKYCIIVLTAGRKTAQPVVPARRVARIRAACTLLCRILSRPLRRTKYRVANRRESSSSSSSFSANAAKPVVVHPLTLYQPSTRVISPFHSRAQQRSTIRSSQHSTTLSA